MDFTKFGAPTAVAISFMACALHQIGPTLKTVAKPEVRVPGPESDAAVINAVAEYFYIAPNRFDGNWALGGLVVLTPEWSAVSKLAFNDQVVRMSGQLDRGGPKAAKVAAQVRSDAMALQLVLDSSGQPVEADTHKPRALKKLELDKRIVLSTYSAISYQQESLVDSSGIERTSRVEGSVSPPTYSPNARYAIVRMSARWSLHEAQLRFLLERTEGRWKVIFADYGSWL
jgi:hypothetical protein